MTSHISIDIETLGISSSSVILSIGAVVFSRKHGLENEFYQELEGSSQLAEGRTFEDKTLQWWLTGNAKLRGSEQRELPETLRNLSSFCKSHMTADSTIWAKGTDFDISILSHAYRQVGLEIPWNYSKVRDLRTIAKLFPPVDLAANLDPHNALEDAKHQARQILSIALLQNLEIK